MQHDELAYPIDIKHWEADEDFPVHPVGSQPKRVVTSPASFVAPGESYIFKTAKKPWQSQQLWSEVIAYRLSEFAGVEVPLSMPAFDGASGSAGVLMRSFLNSGTSNSSFRLVHAGDVMTRILENKKIGRPHSIGRNLLISRLFTQRFYSETDVFSWWAKVLCFDALIGNSDRHPLNWGFLSQHFADGRVSTRLAPVFDNGTSLGYELADDTPMTKLLRHIDRGTHHCSWGLTAKKGDPHVDLCGKFVQSHPESGPAMRSVIQFDLEDACGMIRRCTDIPLPVTFTARRAEMVCSLLAERKRRLGAVLGEVM